MATDRNTTIRASQLRNFSVTAEDIKNNSVTGSKLIDGTVSGTKIADDAISESKLDASNSPIDGYYLKYTAASGMEWAVVGAGVSDHGSLTGLEDDDHTQYLLRTDFTTSSGDIVSQINTDNISEGDSKVEVVDTGTGYIINNVDGAEIARINEYGLGIFDNFTYIPLSVKNNIANTTVHSLHQNGQSGVVVGNVAVEDNSSRGIRLRQENTGAGTIDVWAQPTEDPAGFQTLRLNPSAGNVEISTVATFDPNNGLILDYLDAALMDTDKFLVADGNGVVQYRTGSEVLSDIGAVSSDEMTTISGDIVNQIVTDHGELDGLSDDDHAQYLLVDGTREGTGNFTISGSVSIYNNKMFYCKTTAGVNKKAVYMDTQDYFIFGDTTTEHSYYRAANMHVFQSWDGGVDTKMILGKNVGVQLEDDVTITAGNNLTVNSGTVQIGSAGTLEAEQDSPTGSGVLGYNGHFYATKVYNAVWNDIADFQKVLDEIEYGKCYYDTPEGAKICTERCQMAIIGIASDTYGFGVGNHADERYAPFAIAGWVLAHVDKEYPTGTPLTNNEEGVLTEIFPAEKREFPERIVATYKKKEIAEFWGPNNEIKVNGRSWVKVQ